MNWNEKKEINYFGGEHNVEEDAKGDAENYIYSTWATLKKKMKKIK